MSETTEAIRCIHCGALVNEENTMGFWIVGELTDPADERRYCDAAPDHLHEVAAEVYALDEPADNCEGQDSTEDEREAMQRTCDDCGAAPGEPCSWSCSSNFS
jgi:hypothetical protein